MLAVNSAIHTTVCFSTFRPPIQYLFYLSIYLFIHSFISKNKYNFYVYKH
jgi:hypothetical protein